MKIVTIYPFTPIGLGIVCVCETRYIYRPYLKSPTVDGIASTFFRSIALTFLKWYCLTLMLKGMWELV